MNCSGVNVHHEEPQFEEFEVDSLLSMPKQQKDNSLTIPTCLVGTLKDGDHSDYE